DPPPVNAARLEAASGFEPESRGFADLRLDHLATPPDCRKGVYGKRLAAARSPPDAASDERRSAPLDVERAPLVAHARAPVAVVDRHDVEAQRGLAQAVRGGPELCRPDDPASLGCVDALPAFAVRVAPPLLDLDEHGDAAVARHDVQLAAAAAPVPGQD